MGETELKVDELSKDFFKRFEGNVSINEGEPILTKP